MLCSYSAADTGAEYRDERVCLSVRLSVRDHNVRNHTSDLHRIIVHVTYGRGSVLLGRRSDTLYTALFTRMYTGREHRYKQ